MTDGQYSHDLVVLVADKNMEFAVKGILGRAPAMGIREPISVVHVHPEKDPGCLLRGHEFLSSQLARQVSLERCVDPAFVKLKTTLQTWFSDSQ